MKEQMQIKLSPLEDADRDRFVLDNQEAFRYGALEEFGVRDEHFEEDGEIISRKTIEASIEEPGAEAYRIIVDGEKVGGVVLQIDNETRHNELMLFFVSPTAHGRGIGQAAWRAVEQLHPETEVWETCTPYFEKRNIHFYVNCCGFHIVEFFNEKHLGPEDPDGAAGDGAPNDEMFRFEKVMK